jgi:DNA-binding NarL/FixJ family response regulator
MRPTGVLSRIQVVAIPKVGDGLVRASHYARCNGAARARNCGTTPAAEAAGGSSCDRGARNSVDSPRQTPRTLKKMPDAMKANEDAQPSVTASTNETRLPRRRILLIEAHPIECKGMAALINSQNDLAVCGVGTEETHVLAMLELTKPDLVLLGTATRPNGELELLNSVKALAPEQHILVVSTQDEQVFAPKALRAGASGYVMKQEPTATLLVAIRRVLQGKTFISDRLQAGLRNASATSGASVFDDPIQSLTPREREIFRLLGRDRQLEEIANELSISSKTVYAHRTSIKEKLGLGRVGDVVRMARDVQQSI